MKPWKQDKAEGGAENPSPELWSDQKREEFLIAKYHYLTLHIQPHDFYSYFRAKNVFTQADQEDVENKFHNTWLKAGHLIDIVSRKGKAAFIAFMEVIEYTDPELFERLTERKARDPPPGFIPPMTARMRTRVKPIPSSMRRKNTESMEVLSKLCDLTTSLCSAMTQEKFIEKDIRQLSDFTEQLKNEWDNESKEKQRLIDDLNSAKVDNDQLLSEKVELDTKVDSLRSGIGRTWKKNLEESRKSCDRKVQSLEGEIKRSKTMHPAQSRTRTLPPDVGRGPEDMREANGLPLKKEKDNLIQNLSELEAELSSVKESCDNQDKIIKELIVENNKLCKRNEELEGRLKERSKSIEQKEKDFKELEKRYRDVAELTRTLYEELEITHKQRGKGYRKHGVMPNGNWNQPSVGPPKKEDANKRHSSASFQKNSKNLKRIQVYLGDNKRKINIVY